MRTLIYLRVSTERQAEKDLSLPSQLKICRKYAGDHGYEVIKVFQDAGKSARTDDRPAFLEMIDYCMIHPDGVDAVIVYDTSRFARNREDAIIYKRMLKKKGIRVEYASQNINSDEESGFLVEGIMELFDEHYSRALARVTRRGMMENARRGYWNGGYAPLGYMIEKTAEGKSKLKLDPVWAPTIKRIFELSYKGEGAVSICQALLKDGVRNRNGKPFTKNTILGILENEKYYGATAFNKRDKKNHRKFRPREEWIIIENSHEPIVSKEVFEAVQKGRAKRQNSLNNGSGASGWAFTGILKCGGCGSSMVIETSKHPGGRLYSYYNCRNYRQIGKDVCKGRRVRADELDAFLIDVICKDILSEKNLIDMIHLINQILKNKDRTASEKRNRLKRNIREVNQRLQALYEAIEGRYVNLEDVGERIRKLKNAKNKLTEELQKAPMQEEFKKIEITPRLLQSFREDVLSLIKNSSKKVLRSFFTEFIEKITLNPTDVTIHYNSKMFSKRDTFKEKCVVGYGMAPRAGLEPTT